MYICEYFKQVNDLRFELFHEISLVYTELVRVYLCRFGVRVKVLGLAHEITQGHLSGPFSYIIKGDIGVPEKYLVLFRAALLTWHSNWQQQEVCGSWWHATESHQPTWAGLHHFLSNIKSTPRQAGPRQCPHVWTIFVEWIVLKLNTIHFARVAQHKGHRSMRNSRGANTLVPRMLGTIDCIGQARIGAGNKHSSMLMVHMVGLWAFYFVDVYSLVSFSLKLKQTTLLSLLPLPKAVRTQDSSTMVECLWIGGHCQ